MARRPNAQRKQVRRVAAWIYVVINPIIESLQRELSLLDSANLTWRPRTNQCEMIKTIQEYVDSTQWPNFQDFVAEHPESALITAFRRHDSQLDKLNTAAKEVFVWLLNSKMFLDAFEAGLAQYEAQRPSMGLPAQPLAEMENQVREEAAQHVINNTQTLPSHYVISSFWNFTGRNLLALRNAPEFLPLLRSKDTLGETSATLKKALEYYRLKLSRDYDVPAARVPGLSFEE